MGPEEGRSEDRYLRDIVTAVLGVLREHGAAVDGACVRALVDALSHDLDAARDEAISRDVGARREARTIASVVWTTLEAHRVGGTDATRQALLDAIDACCSGHRVGS